MQSLHVSSSAVVVAPFASESAVPLQELISQIVSYVEACGCSDTVASAALAQPQTAPIYVSDSPEFGPEQVEQSADQLQWLLLSSGQEPCVGPLLLQLPPRPLS